MRQIQDVQEKRRNGWRLSTIIEEILRNSEKLLKEYGDPFAILSQSGLKLQIGEEKEWLDMTTESWSSLSVEKQIMYATTYQKWYAREVGEPLEKEVQGGGISIAMNLIPPGKFWMGSPESEVNRYDDEVRHKVLIDKAFWCGKYEVTQGQWKTIMGNNPSNFKGNDLFPVEQVSWEDCQEFCKKMGVKLLTKEEWEYACRAGTTTAFNIGENITTEEVNYDGNYPYKNGVKSIYRKTPVEVGRFPGNAWGLYDMHGNIAEWCIDLRNEEYYATREATYIMNNTSSYSAFRNGSWDSFAEDCRSASFAWLDSLSRCNDLGFRVSMSNFYSV